MSALGVFAAAGFRRWSAYRLATAAGAFTNSVFGLVKASITVAAIGAAGGALAGYDARAGSTYAWLAQAMIAPAALFGNVELARRIRTGDVAIDLCRPVDLQGQLLADDLGRAAFQLLPRGLPPMIVGALTFGLALPGPGWTWPLGLASVTLAVVISFSCRFMVNLSAFWTSEVRGPNTFYVTASNVLAGMMVPLGWFPGWLKAVAYATPFPWIVQGPIDILAGRVAPGAALAMLGIQLGWAAAMLGAGRLVLRAATARVVVQGG